MSTTTLLIEFLLTGIQAAIWLILIVFSFFGFDWVNPEKLKGSELILAALLLPVVYPIGVFIDNVADNILDRWNERIRSKYIHDEYLSIMKLLTTYKDQWLSDYFDYSRVRIRISRSSALNFFLIMLVSPVFTYTRLHSFLGSVTGAVIAFEVILGIILVGLAIWCWYHITNTFYDRLNRAFNMLQHHKEPA